MAIHPSGEFSYEAVVSTTASGSWQGRASAAAHDRHPGLVGSRPTLDLSGGVLTIRRHRSLLDVLNRHYRGHPPWDVYSFRVGEALEAVIRDGDTLRTTRAGTTDLSVSLLRMENLLVGLGAVGGNALGPGVTFEADPRIHEAQLYHLPKTLADPDTTLAWLDADDPTVDAAIRGIRKLPGNRLVIAIAGRDPEQRWKLNRRVGTPPGLSHHSACWYVDVPARFPTREAWLAYVHQLPDALPADIYVRFILEGHTIDVRERERAFHDPWHLYVWRAGRWGFPGELSQVGIARNHPGLTAEMIVDSVQRIGAPRRP